MSDPAKRDPHAPVALPPGSFDVDKLQTALDRGAKLATDEKQEVATAEAIDRLNERTDEIRDPRHAPYTRMVERERVLVEGTKLKGQDEPVGEVKVVETIQVFDPKAAEAEGGPTAQTITEPNPEIANSALETKKD